MQHIIICGYKIETNSSHISGDFSVHKIQIFDNDDNNIALTYLQSQQIFGNISLFFVIPQGRLSTPATYNNFWRIIQQCNFPIENTHNSIQLLVVSTRLWLQKNIQNIVNHYGRNSNDIFIANFNENLVYVVTVIVKAQKIGLYDTNRNGQVQSIPNNSQLSLQEIVAENTDSYANYRMISSKRFVTTRLILLIVLVLVLVCCITIGVILAVTLSHQSKKNSPPPPPHHSPPPPHPPPHPPHHSPPPSHPPSHPPHHSPPPSHSPPPPSPFPKK